MKIKLMKSKTPKIIILNNAMNKMKEYVNGIDKEIGWLGTAIRDELQFTITDVFLFKQEVHSTTTEITEEGLNYFAMELMNMENGVEIWNNMKLWGHSHVNMGVSPSGQDDKQVETFESCGYDFFIRIICNKKGNVRLDLYDYTTGLIYEELNYEIGYPEEDLSLRKSVEEKINMLNQLLKEKFSLSEVEKEEIKTEIKEKVQEKKYNYSGYGVTVHDYGNKKEQWWTQEDDTEYYNRMFKKNETKEEDVKIIFDNFSSKETFEAFTYMEGGGDLSDILAYDLNYGDIIELEEMIYEYVYGHYQMYTNYLIGMEDEDSETE